MKRAGGDTVLDRLGVHSHIAVITHIASIRQTVRENWAGERAGNLVVVSFIEHGVGCV